MHTYDNRHVEISVYIPTFASNYDISDELIKNIYYIRT